MSAQELLGSAICLVLLCAAIPLGLIPAIRAAREEERRRRCVGKVLAAHRRLMAERDAEVAPRHPVGWPVRIVDGIPYAISFDRKTVHRYSRAQCGWLSSGEGEAARVLSSV